MARDAAARRLVTVTVVSPGATEGVGAVVLRVHPEHTTASVPHGANRLANEISMLQTEHRAVRGFRPMAAYIRARVHGD